MKEAAVDEEVVANMSELEVCEQTVVILDKRSITPKLELLDKILPSFCVIGTGDCQRMCARQYYSDTARRWEGKKMTKTKDGLLCNCLVLFRQLPPGLVRTALCLGSFYRQ